MVFLGRVFAAFAYPVPESGLRREHYGDIRAVLSYLLRDRYGILTVEVTDGGRLTHYLVLLPILRNTRVPAYLTERGFRPVSHKEFNQILRKAFGVSSAALYLQM